MKFSFLKIESYKKGIAFSTAFNFLARLLLFLQSVAIASYFGTQQSTDVFFYCFATVTIASLFINNLDSSVLIPEAMRLGEQEGKNNAMRFLNFFLFTYFFIGILASGLFYLAPIKFFTLLSNFDSATLETNKQIVFLSVPLFTLMITVNLMVNILASYKFFTVPVLVGIFNGVSVLIIIVLFHQKLKITSAVIGLLLAYTGNAFFLAFLMVKNLHWKFSYQWTKLPNKALKNMLFAQAGNVSSILSSYVPLYLLSGFGAGIITSVTYGQKTGELPNQLISQQFSAVAAIKFNELYARNEYTKLNDVFLSIVRALLFILMPISGLIFVFSDAIISVLFERGLFDSQSVEMTALFLKYFGLLLPLLAVNTIVARLLMAAQKIKQSFVYQVLLNSILILMLVLSMNRWGAIGYLYSLLIVHGSNVLLTYVLLRITAPFIEYSNILWYVLKLLVVNSAITTLVYLLNVGFLTNYHQLIAMAAGSFIYCLVILAINYFVHLNENFTMILTLIRNTIKRQLTWF